MPRNAIIIGALAGLAAGLMFHAGLRTSMAVGILPFLAPVPIALAALGWGGTGALTAALTGCIVAAYAGGPMAGVLGLALMFLPVALPAYLFNLAQPGPDGRLVWYPLSRVLLALMLALLGGFLIAGGLLGYTTDAVSAMLVELFGELAAARPDVTVPPAEEAAAAARLYARLLPLVAPALWLLVLLAVLSLATTLTRLSGRLPRPVEGLAAQANLPPAALAIPALGLVAFAMLPSPLTEAGAVALGIGIAGFGVTGLADLSERLKGSPGRRLVMLLAWLSIALFSLPLLIFAGMGMARTLRRARRAHP